MWMFLVIQFPVMIFSDIAKLRWVSIFLECDNSKVAILERENRIELLTHNMIWQEN